VGIVTVRTLFSNPRAAAERLAGRQGPAYVNDVRLRYHDDQLVAFDVVMKPLKATAAEGYPVETVTLYISHIHGFACPPVDDKRAWEHTLGPLTPGSKIVPLCLWYPDDPFELRWMPHQPIEHLLGIVHRHLQAEEYFRRTGRWPVAEAPHGARGPLPITGSLQQETEGRRAS
jgi:hypothetical protein